MAASLFRGWGPTRTLAVVAVALGAMAVFGDPYVGPRVTIDSRELASIVQTEIDHVTPQELAGWIVEGNTEYRLIDLRDDASFAEYHIPTAELVPVGELPGYPLYRNEKIVLYSDGGIHAAQAWMLLRTLKFPGVYTLYGGLDAWKDEVLFPALPDDAGPEQAAAFERARFVAEFFGGAPRTAVDDATAAAPAPMPKVEMPSKRIVVKQKKRKKKGC